MTGRRSEIKGTLGSPQGKFQGQARGTMGIKRVTFGDTMGSYRGHKELFRRHFLGTFNRQFGGKKWAG